MCLYLAYVVREKISYMDIHNAATYERQRGDEVVDVGFLGDVDHLVHGRRPRVVSVGDVVVDGRVKEGRLLRDESQLRAHPLDIE